MAAKRGRPSSADIDFSKRAWAQRRMIALVQTLAKGIDPAELCVYWDVPQEPRDTLLQRLAKHAEEYSRQERG